MSKDTWKTFCLKGNGVCTKSMSFGTLLSNCAAFLTTYIKSVQCCMRILEQAKCTWQMITIWNWQRIHTSPAESIKICSVTSHLKFCKSIHPAKKLTFGHSESFYLKLRNRLTHFQLRMKTFWCPRSWEVNINWLDPGTLSHWDTWFMIWWQLMWVNAQASSN